MTQGRKPLLERSVSTNVHLPETLRARLDLHLFSTLDGRVPKGAYQRFFIERLGEFFSRRVVDIGPLLGQPPGRHLISAKPDTIAAIEAAFQEKQDEPRNPRA